MSPHQKRREPASSRRRRLPRRGGRQPDVKKVSEEIIELHWSGKYRGASFEPVLFEIASITSERVKDAKGRLIPSVLVRLTDSATLDGMEEQTADNQDQVLVLLDATPGMSQAKIAECLSWLTHAGDPLKSKVNRALATLLKHRLAEKDLRGKYRLTDKGKKEAAKLRKST